MPTSRVKAWLRDAFFSAVRFLPGIQNYVLQMRFKPMPTYKGGLVAPADNAPMVGRMFIQPDVEDAAGSRRKLDDVLGPWFSIIGWQTDPQAALSEADREYWKSMGASFMQVNRSRSGSGRSGRITCANGTICVEDIDNRIADWFAAHGGSLVMLRPDRYIGAHGDRQALAGASAYFPELTPAMEALEVAYAVSIGSRSNSHCIAAR